MHAFGASDSDSASAASVPAPRIILIMGVAGSGKTTVGLRLAAALGWPFRDADDFHPERNIAKLSSGIALTDRDRAPWLAAIRAFMEATLANQQRAVLTCSALRQSYRDVLMTELPQVKLVHLVGDYALIHDRLTARQGHFMRPELLESQFATLEPPRDALTVAVTATPDEIVAQIRQAFSV